MDRFQSFFREVMILRQARRICFVALATMFVGADAALAEFPDLSTILNQGVEQEPAQQPAKKAVGGGSAFDCPADVGVVQALVGAEQVKAPNGWTDRNNKGVGQRWNTRLELYQNAVGNGFLMCWYRPQGSNIDHPFLILNRPVPAGFICEKKAAGHFDCHR